jgi:hypothetical protein
MSSKSTTIFGFFVKMSSKSATQNYYTKIFPPHVEKQIQLARLLMQKLEN